MKRITDTSRDAYQDIRADLSRREQQVIDGVRRYWWEHAAHPTSYELLHFLQLETPTLDLNGVRPRLTALEDRHRIRKSEKRQCQVTARTVYTWAVVEPPPMSFFDAVPSTSITQARQLGLL